MDRDRFESELRRTLDDQRLSRGEKRALRAMAQTATPAELDWMRSVAFEVAERALDGDERAREILAWLQDVVKVLRHSDDAPPSSGAFFSPGDEPLRKITGMLSAAQRSVEICVFTITDDRIADAIRDCHRRGVEVRIISDDDKAFDRGSDILALQKHGIAVRVDGSPAHMHHKFALFDRRELLTGSYNWTRSAASENHENVIVTADPRLVAAFGEVFETLWQRLE